MPGEATRGGEGTVELVGMVASLPARLAVGCGVSGFQQRIPRRLERSDAPRRFPRVRHRGRGLDRPCKGPGARRVVFPGLTAAYVAAVFAAVRVAALNAPTLPLIEVNAESDVLPDCSEPPKDRTCVKVSEAPNLLYLYNESGFFALYVFDAQPRRHHKDCPASR